MKEREKGRVKECEFAVCISSDSDDKFVFRKVLGIRSK